MAPPESTENPRLPRSPRQAKPSQEPEKLDSSDLRLVNVLEDFWFTEIKAKIYIYLRKAGKSTAEDIVNGTGLYITSVREALADMHKTGVVKREKVAKKGAGKPPYTYEAIAPRDLIEKMSEDIQEKLSHIFMIDDLLKSPVEVRIPGFPIQLKIEKAGRSRSKKTP
ncbi:MAG: transcriptional regulator [Euryarchaeota archaeon]|nr:transcriptional regulator [Euryarchaeota archaeon]